MKVIQPNCRDRFTGRDLEFVAAALARSADQTQVLSRLLADPATRDELLDDDALFHAILDRPGSMIISARLYFYVLVRHVLRDTGVEDRVVADYVAELLAEFSRMQRVRHPLKDEEPPLDYLVDMVAALQEAGDADRFVLRAHMGNFSLFLAGIFPGHLRARTEQRAAPDLAYYEGVGSASYREAARHRLANRYNLARPLAALSDSFHTTRMALNDMADRLLDLSGTM